MGRISALTELTSLASNDYLVVLDSSANIAKKITIANAFGVPEATWTATGESWVYASWTSGTRIGTITVPTDATTKYQAGMRIKISQSTGGTKYGIIVKVAATLLTVFFQSGTTLNNEAISTPFYSSLKVPYGFNADQSQWYLEASDANSNSKTSPVASTVYGNTALSTTAPSLLVPIGAWDLSYQTAFFCDDTNTNIRVFVSLSTSASSESDSDFTTGGFLKGASAPMQFIYPAYRSKKVVITSPTTYYIVIYTNQAGYDTIGIRGDFCITKIRAVCAYL